MPVSGLARPDTVSATSRLRHDPSLIDGVVDRLRAHVEAGNLPAAGLAIGDAEGRIRSETFAANGRDLSPESLFFLASVTKPIFATAFMQLVETGLVGLDEPIVSYLPEFGNGPHKDAVTARHLLTHTSGVPDYTPDMIRTNRPSAATMTSYGLQSPLTYPPGTRYQYCSVSFYLLAEIIERLTGLDHAQYLRQRLTGPLEMQTTYDPRRSGRPLVAVHGVGINNRFTRFLVLRYLAAAKIPGGGLFGTIDDLLRFGAAVLRPTTFDGRSMPLSPRLIEQMTQDQLGGLPGTYDGEERSVHFGLGWGKPTLMREIQGSPSVVAHGGATGTRLWIDPEAELVLVFFTNQWSVDRGPENEAIRGTYAAVGIG